MESEKKESHLVLTNQERLDKWHKQFLWAVPEELSDKNFRPILSYVFRSLSRGRVPDFELVMRALEPDFVINSCGYINCCIEFEHVH